MSATMEIQRHMDRRLRGMFQKLSGEIQERLTLDALTENAKIVVRSAKTFAPVDSGRLRESIRIDTGKAGRKVKVRRGKTEYSVRIRTGSKAELGIQRRKKGQNTGYYPAHIEFGYKKKSGKQVEAHPFLRPAMYNNEGIIRNTFKSVLGQGLVTEARRAVNAGFRGGESFGLEMTGGVA